MKVALFYSICAGGLEQGRSRLRNDLMYRFLREGLAPNTAVTEYDDSDEQSGPGKEKEKSASLHCLQTVNRVLDALR